MRLHCSNLCRLRLGIGSTRKLHMVTDVLVALYGSPLLVSAMAGTLGVPAENRPVLGVGIAFSVVSSSCSG